MLTVFRAAKDRLEQLVKEGRVSLKVRGRKLDEITASLSEAREKVLVLIKAQKAVERRGYTVQTRQRYKDTHEQREPETDGLKCVSKLRNGVLQDIVYIPKSHVDEWELDLIDEEGIHETETYARGEVLRSIVATCGTARLPFVY